MRRRETAVALALGGAAALSLLLVFLSARSEAPLPGAGPVVTNEDGRGAGEAAGSPSEEGEDVEEGAGGEPVPAGPEGDEGVDGGLEAIPGRRLDGVEEGASRVLEEYRDRRDCLLVRAGYLDFTGGVWGCVIQGDGWAEVCLVAEDDAGEAVVSRWRLDASDLPLP